jgi:hypothetical protein
MWGLQEIFDAGLEKQIDHLKADVVRRRFKKLGLMLTKKQIAGILHATDGAYTLELSRRQERAVRRTTGTTLPDDISIDFSDDDVKRVTSKFSAIFENLIPSLVEKSAITMLREMKKSSRRELSRLQHIESRFEARLSRRWKRPIQLFEMYLTLIKQAGASFNSRYRPQAVKNNDLVFDVVTRLHARSCQIASEIIKLLKGGFADGAHARWRSLHEVVVVAMFIHQQGIDVAERYLLHDSVETFRAATQYQKYCKAIGYKPLSKKEMNMIRNNYDAALQRFGPSFGSQYGWASAALSLKKPTLADIERAAGLEKFRPYYKWASHNVHAGSKGITHKLGLPASSDALLAGASDMGLADPLHGSTISLMQITTTFMTMSPIIDTLTLGSILNKLQKQIGDESLKSQNSIRDSYQKLAAKMAAQATS